MGFWGGPRDLLCRGLAGLHLEPVLKVQSTSIGVTRKDRTADGNHLTGGGGSWGT
jgi:hypothetical protein